MFLIVLLGKVIQQILRLKVVGKEYQRRKLDGEDE
ncbi:hypothetical protein HNQ80_001526 [Anaerosolibacter carboniphilus]|uniref:Uncharacterized protein n=1 Tax=Anaerosolibacter carboniphilus TaxID=1417629 RepID=A0A841KPS3_9FIRM|nr:hypothetical protein [Anaerosolibacter carboniphilus]